MKGAFLLRGPNLTLVAVLKTDPVADGAPGLSPAMKRQHCVELQRLTPGGPRDSPVVSHERDLFSSPVALKGPLSCAPSLYRG